MYINHREIKRKYDCEIRNNVDMRANLILKNIGIRYSRCMQTRRMAGVCEVVLLFELYVALDQLFYSC